MTTPTTIDTETELSAVNTILGAIGQSPVTTLGTITTNVTNTATEVANTFENPEIALIYNILKECNMDVQNEGWTFNREDHVKYYPDSTTKEISKQHLDKLLRHPICMYGLPCHIVFHFF